MLLGKKERGRKEGREENGNEGMGEAEERQVRFRYAPLGRTVKQGLHFLVGGGRGTKGMERKGSERRSSEKAGEV